MRFVQKSRSTVGLIKWTVVQSGWECQYPTHWSSLLDKPLHNTAMMSSHHNMHRLSPRTQVQLSSVRHRWTHARARTHACTYMFKGLWCMCPQTYRHTHIHILANTHPNTPSTLHTNTPAVCPEPLAMLFVSSPLFRERPDLSQASYCVLVQTAGLCRVYLGADVWKHTLSASVSK